MANLNPIGSLCYQIAGITLQVSADLPIDENTFSDKLRQFKVQNPGVDKISLHHHFTLPDRADLILGDRVYHKPPWAVYRDGDRWVYLGIAPREHDPRLWRVALYNHDHTSGDIYSGDRDAFLRGNMPSLTLFPTDQLLIARLLADRRGCYFHASGMVINGQGLLFIGHSGAGKSTMLKLLQDQGEILCDDRVILRRWPEGLKIHGTWSHGEIPIVSNAAAPLRAILLLEQAPVNRLIPLEDRGEIVRRLPFFIIKPLLTADWWEKILDLVGHIARGIPVYRLQFDKTGRVRHLIQELAG